MTIGIIGQGFVGNAVYKKFKQYYDVLTYDLDVSKSNSTKEDLINKSDVIFVCLPTPMNQDGTCNVSIVEGVIKEINDLELDKILVIKSTVIPGTTNKFNNTYMNVSVIFNPEFLTERNAEEDYNSQKRIILGGPRPSTTILKQVFSKVFPHADIIKTDSTYAEMVKYLTNTFLSVKVSFANEMYQLCQALNLDYDKVVEYSIYDERLGKSHWSVPGPDGDFGFGGHCFPKDLSALICLTKEMNTINKVLTGAQETNLSVRTNKDWEKMKGRAVV
jgi:UDPglucose 6-dehydrogenase